MGVGDWELGVSRQSSQKYAVPFGSNLRTRAAPRFELNSSPFLFLRTNRSKQQLQSRRGTRAGPLDPRSYPCPAGFAGPVASHSTWKSREVLTLEGAPGYLLGKTRVDGDYTRHREASMRPWDGDVVQHFGDGGDGIPVARGDWDAKEPIDLAEVANGLHVASVHAEHEPAFSREDLE